MKLAIEILREKLVTVLIDRKEGRGDYDRLTALAEDLRKAIAELESFPE